MKLKTERAGDRVLQTLNGIPDQDTYYDIVDSLEEQGMERLIQYYMSKQGTDLDLLQQFRIYEVALLSLLNTFTDTCL